MGFSSWSSLYPADLETSLRSEPEQTPCQLLLQNPEGWPRASRPSTPGTGFKSAAEIQPWEHSPPTARQQQEMLLEKGSFSWKETSPSFLLIPVVLIFPFRARQQLCLGLEWSAVSCDGAKCCLPAASREILSHVAAGNVSGILCWSTQTNCIQRHAVFVQLIRPVLKPE